jgi:hypothetical protein
MEAQSAKSLSPTMVLSEVRYSCHIKQNFILWAIASFIGEMFEVIFPL